MTPQRKQSQTNKQPSQKSQGRANHYHPANPTNRVTAATIRARQVVWDRDAIKALLWDSPRACEHALVVLLDRQTSQEKDAHTSKLVNGVGFNRRDAMDMTALAQSVKYRRRRLTQAEHFHLKVRLAKYWRQLIEAIQERNPDARVARELDVKVLRHGSDPW